MLGLRPGRHSVANYSESTIAIAGMIENYLASHPRAADTPEGIRDWWLAVDRQGESLPDVQAAVDYLVGLKRLSRTTLVDGTVVYARVHGPGEER